MPAPLPTLLLDLAGLLSDLDRRRLARALCRPAPLVDDDQDAYDALVRASADLDDHAELILADLTRRTPAP